MTVSKFLFAVCVIFTSGLFLGMNVQKSRDFENRNLYIKYANQKPFDDSKCRTFEVKPNETLTVVTCPSGGGSGR